MDLFFGGDGSLALNKGPERLTNNFGSNDPTPSAHSSSFHRSGPTTLGLVASVSTSSIPMLTVLGIGPSTNANGNNKSTMLHRPQSSDPWGYSSSVVANYDHFKYRSSEQRLDGQLLSGDLPSTSPHSTYSTAGQVGLTTGLTATAVPPLADRAIGKSPQPQQPQQL